MNINMAKHLKMSSIVTLLTGFVSFGFLMYNVFAYEIIKQTIGNLEPLGDEIDRIAVFIAIGIIISFMFHISSFIFQTMRFQFIRTITTFEAGVLLTGIISFVLLIGDLGALNDIGNQYAVGLTTAPEMLYLYAALVPHGIFHLLQIFLTINTFFILKRNAPDEPALKDEIVFIVAQYVGIACGMFGLGFTSIVLIMGLRPDCMFIVLPFYCPFIIFPYILMCIYWVVLKRHEPIAEICDEKQWRDLERAGLTALLVSLPVMAILYVSATLSESGSMGLLWFPLYVFLIVLAFSASTLYFTSREWASG